MTAAAQGWAAVYLTDSKYGGCRTGQHTWQYRVPSLLWIGHWKRCTRCGATQEMDHMDAVAAKAGAR